MEFLWRKGESLTISDMEDRLDEKEWNRVTLYRTVRELIDAGFLMVSGVEKGRTQYHRMIDIAVSREEYIAWWLEQKNIHISDIGNLVVAMLGGSHSEKDNEELIKELEQVIEKIRNGKPQTNEEEVK